ncbi:MAG: hemerythrin domain-containing protein [Actinobacteria bacterium]|nr:hemerythrin domain-containing protein [Actinomycetota bacterium]
MSEAFSTMFRDEHRQVRDGLLDLSTAFGEREGKRAGELLGRIAALTGPHFRYEEESMYPLLVQIFGPEYIDALIDDHDVAIAGARRLVELAGTELDDADVEEAQRLIRAILPHVSDCDGLSIMVERLDAADVAEIFAARERTLDADLDLLTWDDTVRTRPVLVA